MRRPFRVFILLFYLPNLHLHIRIDPAQIIHEQIIALIKIYIYCEKIQLYCAIFQVLLFFHLDSTWIFMLMTSVSAKEVMSLFTLRVSCILNAYSHCICTSLITDVFWMGSRRTVWWNFTLALSLHHRRSHSKHNTQKLCWSLSSCGRGQRA